ncbi:MAG TPA: ABC transporter substrate-binding protein [Thermoanaerobaculia bacterium]|jgi:hypothetical protein
MKLLLAVLFATPLFALTPSEQRGRAIYFGGASPSGRAITSLVAGATELPASSLPCGSCHGPDGAGVAEGTITPADIRSSVLSQPRLTARIRPRYDDAALRRAIGHGADSAGNALSPVMPRYRMHDDDLADLVAYLRKLGDPVQPGLTDTSITIATNLRDEPTLSTLNAFAKDINAAGGIYGRALHIDTTVDPGRTFAIVCATDIALDPYERIPLLTPFPVAAPEASSFFLYADLETQALALLQTLPEPRAIGIQHDGSEAALAAAAALGEVSPSPTHLFVLGNAGIPKSELPLLLAGAPITRDLLESRRDITLAIPTLPTDITAEGRRELEAFLARHQLPRTQLATQIATYATAKVLVEGLKRAGRDLTREKLIAALERLYEFPTGLTPPVTFNRNRHIGSAGAHVVSADGTKRTFVHRE